MKSVLFLALAVATAATAPAPEEETINPQWLRRPSADELHAVWPAAALRSGKGGRATISCEVSERGMLENCKVESETPSDLGFGEAALLLTPQFLMKPGTRDGKPVRSTVRIPIRFSKPIKSGGRTPDETVNMLVDPVYTAAPTSADVLAAWPAKADAQTATGYVFLRCEVMPEGVLEDCETLTETPKNQGFGAAAKALTPKFRIRLAPDARERNREVMMNLAINFTNPAAKAPAGPPALTRPTWIRGLDPVKAQNVFPSAAAEAGLTKGTGVAACKVGPQGMLVDCRPTREDPVGLGFGAAAVAVASIMQMSAWEEGWPVEGAAIRLPIHFNLSEEEPAP